MMDFNNKLELARGYRTRNTIGIYKPTDCELSLTSNPLDAAIWFTLGMPVLLTDFTSFYRLPEPTEQHQ